MMADNNNALRLVIDETIEQNQTIRVLKSDVAELKKGQRRLEDGLRRLEEGLTHLGLSMEDLKKNLNLLIDAVIPAKARAAQIDQVRPAAWLCT